MEKLKKIWDVVSVVLVTLVVIIAILLAGARVAGLQVYNVISGSMRPTYREGDLIYVKTVDAESIKPGDAITFVLNEKLTVATHRVVSVDGENSLFYTKGDANKNPDEVPVHFKNLIGKPVFKVPLLGYVSDFVQHPPGTYIAIAGVAALAIGVFLPDVIQLFSGKKKEAESNEQTDDMEETQ